MSDLNLTPDQSGVAIGSYDSASIAIMEIPTSLALYNRNHQLTGYVFFDSDDYALIAPHVWHLGHDGYAVTNVHTGEFYPSGASKKRLLYMHRLLLGLTWGNRQRTDHINRNRLDNHKTNLRVGTQGLNLQNLPSKGGSSQYRGVSRDSKNRNKWVAYAGINYQQHRLGRFDTEEEAHQVVSAWRAIHMPWSEDAR